MSNIKTLLQEETLQQVELEPVVKVQRSESIRSTIQKINQHLVRAAVIVEKGKPIGSLTQRDILLKIALKNVDLDQPVETVMIPPPQEALTLQSTLEEAIGLIMRHQRMNLPIVDQSGKTVNVTTSRALINHIAAHFPKVIYNLPPNPKQTSHSLDGG